MSNKSIHEQYLDQLSDIDLIKRYQCCNCKDKELNTKCKICETAFNILDKRHEIVISKLASKLHYEFHKYNKWSVEDFKAELKLEMIINLKESIDLNVLDNKYKSDKYSWYYYLRIRKRLQMKYNTKKRGTLKVLVDSLDCINANFIPEDINEEVHFVENIFLDYNMEKLKDILEPFELKVFWGIIDNYTLLELGKKFGYTEPWIHIVKNRVIKKLKQAIKNNIL